MNNDIPKTQICFSTENQMVNLILIRMLKPQQVGYFTITNSSKNDKWDNNLVNVLGNEILINIPVSDQDVLNIEKLKEIMLNKLAEKNLIDKQLLWNITGGQRYFVVAAYDLFRDRVGDVICYLEGNKNEITLLRNEEDGIRKLPNITSDIDITIEEAVKLMGFKEGKAEPDCLIKFKKEAPEFRIKKFDPENYLTFFEKFLGEEGLRKFCLQMNRTNDKKDKYLDEFKKLIKENSLDNIWELLGANKFGSFGKVFEFMVGAKIFDIISSTQKHNISEIAISREVTFADKKNSDENNTKFYSIDEFDIAILTRNGKFIVFECKTGNMAGDVAKSHRYSTYAIGGVYGLPVLLVPLTRTEITDLNESRAEDDIKNLKRAINAAKRAQLEDWSIDEIESNLIQKFNLINEENKTEK
ncbi:MAG: DUF1887 family protein [Candidatus Lokiarchaeota archaeon]|nr:DUF1887 family protein [Candidatus Lokiarchaeota archaeon]